METNISPHEPTPARRSTISYWLRTSADRATSLLRAKLEAAGVTLAESILLQELVEASPASHTMLVLATGMPKGAVSKTIGSLQKKGLIARGVIEEDRRSAALALTRKGRALVPAIARIVDAHEKVLVGNLTQRDRAMLLKLLQSFATELRE